MIEWLRMYVATIAVQKYQRLVQNKQRRDDRGNSLDRLVVYALNTQQRRNVILKEYCVVISVTGNTFQWMAKRYSTTTVKDYVILLSQP